MSNPYFDACRQAAANIDVPALSELEPAAAIGRGSFFAFSPLGQLSLGGPKPVYAGLKRPNIALWRPIVRLEQELTFIATVIDHSPEFQALVPAFMGLVAIEGEEEATAILTEDASEGGRHAVVSRPASPDVRRMLMKPFEQPAGNDAELNRVRCNRILAFNVSGRQRLLDFTPFPVNNVSGHASYTANSLPAMDLAAETTIRVPADSPLGRHLVR